MGAYMHHITDVGILCCKT